LLARRLAAEFVGTALLLIAVVGSGIAPQRLSPNDEYRSALIEAGFQDPEFQVHATESMPEVDGKIGSAYIRARRP
jgi:hypothetical protein